MRIRVLFNLHSICVQFGYQFWHTCIKSETDFYQYYLVSSDINFSECRIISYQFLQLMFKNSFNYPNSIYRPANTTVHTIMQVLFNTGLHRSTGCGISVTGHNTGGECCLHCNCVCPYENAEKRTHQHRKVNTIIDFKMYNYSYFYIYDKALPST